MSLGTIKRFFRLLRFEDHLELARIHAVAGTGDLEDYEYAQRKRGEWSDEDIAPRPLVNGQDLIDMGFLPGPQFKEILRCVEDEQLEGRLVNRDQAIDFIKRTFGTQKS